MFRGRRARPEISFVQILDTDGSSTMYRIKERGDVIPVEIGARSEPVMPIFTAHKETNPSIEKRKMRKATLNMNLDVESSDSESEIPKGLSVDELLNHDKHMRCLTSFPMLEPGPGIHFPQFGPSLEITV